MEKNLNIFFSVISQIFFKNNAINLNFHDYLYYSSTFSLKLSTKWVTKKRNEKESIIFLTPKPNQSFFNHKAKNEFSMKNTF